MHPRPRPLLLLLLLLSLSLALPAQNTAKRAKERTERKANQRVDQKIDTQVDKAFNAIEGLFKKKKNNKDTTAKPTDKVEDGGLRANDDDAYADDEEATQAMMNALGLGGDQGDYEPYENEHTFSLTMTSREIKKNGKEEINSIRMGAKPDRTAMVMDDGKGNTSQLIFNTQTGKTTTISTDKKGQKTGVRMRMPNFGKRVAELQEEMEDYITFDRTGERKTIDGYDCEKIIVTDNKHNTTTVSWITDDLGLSSMDVFGSMASIAGMGKQAFKTPTGELADLTGLPIMSSTDDGKKIIEMHLTDIKIGEGAVDQSLFDVSGVEIEEVGW